MAYPMAKVPTPILMVSNTLGSSRMENYMVRGCWLHPMAINILVSTKMANYMAKVPTLGQMEIDM